jgi:hypothetical protein
MKMLRLAAFIVFGLLSLNSVATGDYTAAALWICAAFLSEIKWTIVDLVDTLRREEK